MTKSLTFVEIDIPAFTQNSPPDSPPIMDTYRFTTDVSYLPSDIYAIPSIRTIDITPAIISLGENLGQRAVLTVIFRDHKHIFDTESYSSGTFFGKFRARYGLKLRGMALRLITGTLGQAFEDMETRYFLVENTDGPTYDGTYKLIAKDVLKLTDGDRALAPALSPGQLLADITETSHSATLTPTGIGDSDYPGEAYLAIGGKEIVATHRDAFTSVLMHFDDADAVVIFTDSALQDRVITVTGSAQIDTGQSQFGGSSLQVQGSDDYIDLDGDADLAFGTGDFTIEFFARFGSVGTDVICDFRAASGDLAPTIQTETTADTLRYHTAGVLRITGATTITTGVWHHIAVSRSGTSTRLFLNGVKQGATFVDTTNYIVGASRPRLGADFAAANDWTGHIDEFRVTKGFSHYSTDGPHTVPVAPFTLAASGDVIKLSQRGQMGTEASSHEAGDRVQELLIYDTEDPADIISDLLQTYALVPSSYIPLATWLVETGSFLNQVYSAVIAEPTPVNRLIGELCQQATLAVWPDELAEQIRLQVLRAIPTTADIYDEDNILAQTLEVREQPEKRLSRVEVYFGQRNPLANQDQLENYRSTVVVEDLAAAQEYGSVAIKQIFSRWIPFGGSAIAEQLGEIHLSRFVTPPRRFSFDLLRHSLIAPILGGGYQLGGWPFQEIAGSPALLPIQITRLNPRADRWEVEAEEMLFEGEADPAERTIVIDSNTNNINLRELHDTLYTDAESGDSVICIIQEGVLVGSVSTGLPAFDVGEWPVVGSPEIAIQVVVRGRIQGAGGNGGQNSFGGDGQDGFPGGTALYTRNAVSLVLNMGDGEVWSGGGGGGGTENETSGGSGGGGAGTIPGQPGALEDGQGVTGFPGSSEAGGVGGDGTLQNGGAGGGPGLAGATATGSDAGVGGAAGSAIDGISFVTKTGTGDVRGAEVN